MDIGYSSQRMPQSNEHFMHENKAVSKEIVHGMHATQRQPHHEGLF